MRHRKTRAVVAALAVALLATLPMVTASAQPAEVDAAVAAEVGYHLVTADGEVLVYGTADDDGDLASIPLNGDVVDGAGTTSGDGYWLAAEDGGVFAFGDAGFYGSAGALPLNKPVVGMSQTPSGLGYWLVASDGGVFSYGDATFYGSTGSLTLNSPVTDIEPTPSGAGYWLVAEDGGIFSYGDAQFHGSLGGSAISSPVVAMAANSDGSGYWLVRADGTIDEFGAATPLADLSGVSLEEPVVAAVRTITGQGLWLTTREGGVYAVGDATLVGSNKGGSVGGAAFQAAAVDVDEPVVGIFPEASGDFELTILHNNDGESNLVNGGGANAAFGGIAHFATMVDRLRDQVMPGNAEGEILLSSGDNFLAGTALLASFDKGVPWYDSIALRRIGYDAMAIGNHEFDFGPNSLADFIEGFNGTTPFLTSNLNFSAVPDLKALVTSGDIAKSKVITVNGRKIGVVGATTPLLPSISSPGAVVIDSDVKGAIEAEVTKLENKGADIIILISHLQNVNEDLDLIGELSGIDVAIAGGGDELLANADDLLIDGQVADPDLPYPIIEEDADGNDVPVVTTPGNYLYVGKLVLTFDKDGNLKQVEDASGPVRVANSTQSDAVPADPTIQAQVVDPVVAYQASLAATDLATVQVVFENNRGVTWGSAPAGKRVQETNLGNLITDAFVWQADSILTASPGSFPSISTGQIMVGLENGGGMRVDAVIGSAPSWQITAQDVFDINPFGNVLAVVDDMTPAELKAVLEQAYSELPDASGGFLQVSNMTVTVDFDQAVGSRVTDITVDTNGTPVAIVTGGAVVSPGTLIDVATNSFSAGGGDSLPFPTDDTTTLGLTDQQTVSNYLTDAAGLNGLVTAAQYPEVAVGGGVRLLISGTP